MKKKPKQELNFNDKELKSLKMFHEMLIMIIIKNNKWGKKLPSHIQSVLDNHNLILNLIEDIEQLK